MDTKRVPWISLWLIIFASACVWLLSQRPSETPLYQLIIPVLILAALVYSALRDVYLSFWQKPDEYRPSRMNRIAGAYLDAWRTLWRQKWLLWFFGIIAAINLIAGLTEIALQRYPGLNIHDIIGQISRLPAPPHIYLTSLLPRSFPATLSDTPDSFFPSIGLSTSPIAYAILAIIIAIGTYWLYKRMSTLKTGTEYSQESMLFIRFLIPVILVLAIPSAIVGRLLMYILTLTGVENGSSYAYYMVTSIVSKLAQPIILSALLAGLIGSLFRMKSGQVMEAYSFLTDTLRYVKPLFGLNMLILILWTLISLPEALRLNYAQYSSFPYLYPTSNYGIFNYLNWLLKLPIILIMFLMFVPYVIVSKRVGTFAGIRQGIQNWLSNWGDTISFIAFGITVIIAKTIIVDILGALIPMTSPVDFLYIPVYVIVNAIMAAVIVIATWEFYSCFVSGDNSGGRSSC